MDGDVLLFAGDTDACHAPMGREERKCRGGAGIVVAKVGIVDDGATRNLPGGVGDEDCVIRGYSKRRARIVSDIEFLLLSIGGDAAVLLGDQNVYFFAFFRGLRAFLFGRGARVILPVAL